MVGRSLRLVTVPAALIAAAPAWAARVELVVEPRELQVGQIGTAQVVVTDAEGGAPVLAKVDGLDVTPTGSSQNLSIWNGVPTRARSFQYQVVARKPGLFLLGPARVQIDSPSGPLTVETAAVSVKVTPAAQTDISGSLGVDVSTDWDTPVAWDGQVVVYHYRLRTKVSLAGSQWFGLPQEGFTAPRDGEPERKEYQIGSADGPMIVDETWAPLIATGPGTRGQEPAGAQVEVFTGAPQRRGIFDLFRPTKTHSVLAPASPLEVKPLPKAPPGFSGLVGVFRGTAEWAAPKASTGGSVELRLALEGNGSLEGLKITTPAIEGAQVYEGGRAPRGGLVDGRYVSAEAVTFSVVPTQVGTLNTPPFEIVVFDTAKGTYETLRVPVPPLPVAQGTGATAEVRAFSELPTPEVEVEVEDGPRPIRSVGRATAPALAGPLRASLQGGLGLLGAILAFGGGMRGAAWARSRRAAAAPRPLTMRERFAALPQDPRERLLALDGLVRDLLVRAPGEAAPVHRALSRLRFGDGAGDAAAIEASVGALIAKVAE